MRLRKNDLFKFAHRVLIAEINNARVAEQTEQTFDEAIKDQKFKHPETKNDVSFGSLPQEEQKKIRSEFNKSKSKEELSKEDQKALDALGDLDLDSEDLAKLLEGVSKNLEDIDLTDEDIKELMGMDSDELQEQAKALIKNTEGAGDALSKAVDNIGDDDDDDDDNDDYEDGLDRVLNKEVKLDKKSEAHFNEIENLIISDAISVESLQSIVEGLLDKAQDDDFDDIIDMGFEDFDADELTKIMKAVFSKDSEMAGEVNADLRKSVVNDVIESGEYLTDNDLGEEIEGIVGNYNESLFENSDDMSRLSLDQLKDAKKVHEQSKKLIKDKFKEIKSSLEEKFGGDEELIEEALVELGFEPDADPDNEDDMEVMLSDYGVSLDPEFDSLIEEKTKEEKAKTDKAKAKADKENKDKENKAKADKENKAKADSKKENSEKAKDKSYRDKTKKELLKGVDGLSKELTMRGDFEEKQMEMESHFENIGKAYGIESLDDLENLDDEALKDFIDSIEEANEVLTAQVNEGRKSQDKEIKEAPAKIKDLKAKSKKMQSRFDELDQLDWDDMSLEEQNKVGKEYSKLDKDLQGLDEEIEELEELKGYGERGTLSNDALTTYSKDGQIGELLKGAVGLQKDKKKQKELEETKKKEEEEHKQKVKEYTKKISDIASSADSADSPDKVNELWGEFGRIKGQLSGSKVLDEVKGDMDKARKSLDKSQERNSFSGKLKSFFGWGGKKANQDQKQKVAKVALEILKEEISLYKEEESKRRR